MLAKQPSRAPFSASSGIIKLRLGAIDEERMVA
jgi:hypothetical protein